VEQKLAGAKTKVIKQAQITKPEIDLRLAEKDLSN